MITNHNLLVTPKPDEITVDRIEKLCDIILIDGDTFDFEEAKKYIEEHINNNIAFNGDRYGIRSIVQKRLSHYIKSCPSSVQLFSFISDNNYRKFRNQFHEYYYSHYYSVPRNKSPLVYPIEFDYVFDFIQEAIDFYVLYEDFSLKLEDIAVERAVKEATKESQKAVASSKLAAVNAKNAAEAAADKAVESAIDQVVEKKRLDDRITASVDSQMNKVTSKVSETSVTILGIFSGIVLTVVAGLFYSASVLENINAADFDKLLCAASLVGLVCIDLMAIMFLFVKQLSKRDQKPIDSILKSIPILTVILLINIVLIITMTNAGIKQASNSNPSKVLASDKTDINVFAQVNIPSNDRVKDSAADTGTNSDKISDSDGISNHGSQSDATDTNANIQSSNNSGTDATATADTDIAFNFGSYTTKP